MSARLMGLIVAVLLGAAFIATAVAWRGPARIVVPTDRVTAGGKIDNLPGVAALPDLKARTEMQRWPGDTANPPSAGRALGSPRSGPPVAGEQRVQEWSADKDANRDILDKPQPLKGVSSLPEAERAVLMQPQGRTWRHIHNETLFHGGALYIFGISLL